MCSKSAFSWLFFCVTIIPIERTAKQPSFPLEVPVTGY